MRVAIAGNRGIPAKYGGFETSADETARVFRDLGHEVTVFCRTPPSKDLSHAYSGIGLVHVPAIIGGPAETIAHSLTVAFYVIRNRKRFDILHAYNAGSSLGCAAVRLMGMPVVITSDGIEWRREKWGMIASAVWRGLTWLSFRAADIVVCDSKTVKDYFARRYRRDAEFIPYGAKRIRPREGMKLEHDLVERKYLLFVGRLVPEKGVHTLIAAYRQLRTNIPLVIIGDGPDIDYVRILKESVPDGVKFLGYRYGAEYENLLANALAYVSASSLEGTSPSLLAAMGGGVCCLVNGIDENRETGGDAVMYFDGSVQDLAAKMNRVISDGELVRRYAMLGFKRVECEYDWTSVSGQYLRVYSEAIRRRFKGASAKGKS